MKEVLKICGCCKKTYTKAQWEDLPYVGQIDVPADTFGPRTITELRNCSCGSTIAIDHVEG